MRTSIEIQLLPIGSYSNSNAVLDEFTPGELTVTSTHPSLTRVYRPGTWTDATTYDERGYPLASFKAEVAR